MSDPRYDYHRYFPKIAQRDIDVLSIKDVEYGASWKRRGGIGAFMMLARKWDRLEEQMTKEMSVGSISATDATGTTISHRAIDRYDVIERAMFDQRDEGLLDDIGDLRRYLLALEAEIMQRRADAEAELKAELDAVNGRGVNV